MQMTVIVYGTQKGLNGEVIGIGKEIAGLSRLTLACHYGSEPGFT